MLFFFVRVSHRRAAPRPLSPTSMNPILVSNRILCRCFAVVLGGVFLLACSTGTNARSESEYVAPEVVAEQPWSPPAAPPSGSPVDQYGALKVVGTQIVNQSGQAVQLKGLSSQWINSETKGYSQDKKGLEWLRDHWQLRVFRVAMGVELNGGYLTSPNSMESKVRNAVHNAIDLGVYVIIDWHDHHAHLNQDAAVGFFTKMAREFGQYPNVIYETFNEPVCIPKKDYCPEAERLTWQGELKPYHERLVAAIRAEDPDNLIVLGTPTWSQDVDKAAESPLDGSNLLYTLHFYSGTHKQSLIDRAEAAVKSGLPIFITEWGATDADGGLDGILDPKDLEVAQLWHNWMNKRYVSHAAWKLDGGKDTSCIFKAGTPVGGGWTEDQFSGHAPFVRDRMLEAAPPKDLAEFSAIK
jgi:endoglucanase